MTTAVTITQRGTTVATPQSIASMALTHDPLEIADRLGLSERDVVAILSRTGRLQRSRIFAVCDKTGRRVAGYSERSVYIKAQIAGFTDWHMERDTARPNAEPEAMSVVRPIDTGFRHKIRHPKTRLQDPAELVRLVKDGASSVVVAERLGITRAAAKKRIQAARKRGLLPVALEA
jgi:DNA-binding CsgD family transcriptional regulator